MAAWLLSILLYTSKDMESQSDEEGQEETEGLSEGQTFGRAFGQNLTEYEEREKVGLVF